MAEYIEREAAIKTAEHAYNEWNLAMAAADGKREINLVYKRQKLCKAVASVFDSTPAADVVPVVHCKDCKYFDRAEFNCKGFKICPASGMDVTPDDFCSYADRRDSDST